MTKGVDKRIDENVFQWRGWRRIGMLRVYVGECAGSRLVGSLRKRSIDTVKYCVTKRFGCQASKESGAG